MRRLVVALSCVAVVAGCAAKQAPPPRSVPASPPGAPRAESNQTRFVRARQQLDAKQYAPAAAGFDALVSTYPEMQDYSLHYLALSRAGAGDTAGAEAAWQALIETHPRSLFVERATLGRGRLLLADGDGDAAEILLIRARDAGDADVSIQASIGLADVALDRGDAAAAQTHLLEARRRAPGSPAAAPAKQRLTELRREHPELAPTGVALERETKLLLAERDHDGARAAAAAWVAVAPAAEQPSALRMQADAEHGAGDVDAGLATLEAIVLRYPASPAAPEAQFRYATLQWNRDYNAEAQQAFREFRRRYPNHARTPEVLYALARIDQSDGHADSAIAAYTEIADAFPAHALARESRWRIAWIRYQDGRWSDAAAAFTLAAGGKSVGDAPDAAYWRARALERGGDAAGAARLYQAIIDQAPSSYYAMWAERRAGRDSGGGGAVVDAASPPSALGPPPPSADPYHWSRAAELREMGMSAQARRELAAFEADHSGDPGARAALPRAFQAVGGYREAIRLSGGGDPSIAYPLAFWAEVSRQSAQHDVDPLLVLSLMRQESLFDPTARSPADARGLMQLLPSTAQRVAGADSSSAAIDLYDPDVNVALGTAYLGQLMRQYGGDPLKSLAAYNGGEPAVAKWEQRFGALPPDEFVESITFRETRDYVKKVMGNYRRYQQLYAR